MKRPVWFLLAFLICASFYLTACSSEQNAASKDVLQQQSQSQTGSFSSHSSFSETAQSSESTISSLAVDDPEQKITPREKDWQEDLDYFKEAYVKKHKDPFYYVSEEELDRQIEQLKEKIPELSDTDCYFELAKIVANLKDAHTSISPTEIIYTRIFPISVRYFGDKLYLCGYYEEFKELKPYLLHEIVSVNGVDIRYLQKKAESVIDMTNTWRTKETFPSQYFTPAFLEWAGCDSTNGYEFKLLDNEQRVVSVKMPTITQDATISGVRVRPKNWEKLFFLGGESGVRLVEDEQGGACVVVSFGSVLSNKSEFYQELFRSAASLLTEHPEAKLLIDLRHNVGGWYSDVGYIRNNSDLLTASRKPQIYVAADGFTTSAAIDVLLFYKETLNALQIGEPTGQFSSYFMSAGGGRTLPNSKIPFRISQGWQDAVTSKDPLYDETGKLYEWENTVLPDVYVSQTIKDIKAGKDSVIEWILEH